MAGDDGEFVVDRDADLEHSHPEPEPPVGIDAPFEQKLAASEGDSASEGEREERAAGRSADAAAGLDGLPTAPGLRAARPAAAVADPGFARTRQNWIPTGPRNFSG